MNRELSPYARRTMQNSVPDWRVVCWFSVAVDGRLAVMLPVYRVFINRRRRLLMTCGRHGYVQNTVQYTSIYCTHTAQTRGYLMWLWSRLLYVVNDGLHFATAFVF